jgi:hypothetical protein
VAERWLQLGWVTVAALGGWLAYELTWTPRVAAPPPAARDVAPAGPTTLQVEPPNLAALRVTLERPLFEPERRPKVEEAVAVAAEPEPAPKLPPVRLMGVVVKSDGGRLALVQAEGQEQPARVRAGEQVAGWRIDEIGDESVVLVAGAGRSVVPLRVFDENPGKGPGRPVPRPRPSVAGKRPAAPSPAPAPVAVAVRAEADTRIQPVAAPGRKRAK